MMHVVEYKHDIRTPPKPPREQRVALGAHRLADLLTTLFASIPIRLDSVIRTKGDFGFSWNTVSGKTTHRRVLERPDQYHCFRQLGFLQPAARANSAILSGCPMRCPHNRWPLSGWPICCL